MAFEKKAAYWERIDAQIGQLMENIVLLQGIVSGLHLKARMKYSQDIKMLKGKLTKVEIKLMEFAEDDGNNWQKIRPEVEHGLDDLIKSVEATSRKIDAVKSQPSNDFKEELVDLTVREPGGYFDKLSNRNLKRNGG